MNNVELEFIGGKSSYILEAKNAIDRTVCQELISECVKYYDKIFNPGPTLGGLNPFIKSSMDFNFSGVQARELGVPFDNFYKYEKIIEEALFGCLAFYQKTYNELWNWPGICDTGFRLQHYVKNFGHYRQHSDGSPWGGPNAASRVLAGIVYLNDVEVGGDTYFPYHDVSVAAKSGTIALFPTSWTHPHQGNPAISNDKWIISTFYLCSTNSSYQTEETIEVEEEDLKLKKVKVEDE